MFEVDGVLEPEDGTAAGVPAERWSTRSAVNPVNTLNPVNTVQNPLPPPQRFHSSEPSWNTPGNRLDSLSRLGK
jgi:hypothetical protein